VPRPKLGDEAAVLVFQTPVGARERSMTVFWVMLRTPSEPLAPGTMMSARASRARAARAARV